MKKTILYEILSWFFAAWSCTVSTNSSGLQPSCLPPGISVGTVLHLCMSSAFQKKAHVSSTSYPPSLSFGSPWNWSARKMWTSMSSELPTNSKVIWPIFCKVSTVSPHSSRSSLYKKIGVFIGKQAGREQKASISYTLHSELIQWLQLTAVPATKQSSGSHNTM